MKYAKFFLVIVLGLLSATQLNVSDSKQIQKEELIEKIAGVGKLIVFVDNSPIAGSTCFPYKREEGYTYFLTCKHVFFDKNNKERKYNSLEIHFQTNNNKTITDHISLKLIGAEKVKIGLTQDYGIVRIKTKEKFNLFRLNFEKPELLIEIYGVGYPLMESLRITKGILGPEYLVKLNTMAGVDCFIAPGFSGGPVINVETGEVIGILNSVYAYGPTILGGITNMVPMYCLKDFF